jgi:hypothetical protein
MLSLLLAGLLLQAPTPTATPTMQPLAQVTLQCAATGISTSATYQWQNVEGPADAAFEAATAPTTKVSFIDEGTYLLRCVVMDPGKTTTWADWALVVGANFIPETPPTSTVKVSVVQIPPPDVTDNVSPIITKVLYGVVQLTAGQVVTIPATATYVGLNVTATDNLGVQSAQLIVDNNHVYNVGVSGKLPSAFNLWWLDNPIPAGNHPAVIRVYDGIGNFAEFKFILRR